MTTRLLITVVVAIGWIGVRGRLDLTEVVVSLAIGAAMATIVARRLPRGPSIRRLPRILRAALRVGGNFLLELIVSNAQQLAVVFRPHQRVRPHWAELEPRLETTALRAALGWMIALTPMTIFCDDRQTGGRWLLLHVLDTDDLDASVRNIRRRMEDPLLELEAAWSG